MLFARKLHNGAAGALVILLLLVITSAFMVIPLVYAVSSSLKPLSELWIFPPEFFVRNPTLKNFSDLMALMGNSQVPFSRYIFNTLFIAIAGTAGHVILASMCAFSISKLRFKGAQIVFRAVVYSLMFSTAVTQIPNFIVIKTFGLIDTYAAIILPACASSLGLYLMKQFMESMIPETILEAARIDGASNMRIFWRIAMPMVKPAWLTLIVFSFQALWNMGPNVLIQSDQLKSLNYAITQIAAAGLARAGTVSAATVIMMVLPITVFCVSQANVIETMSTSGIKE